MMDGQMILLSVSFLNTILMKEENTYANYGTSCLMQKKHHIMRYKKKFKGYKALKSKAENLKGRFRKVPRRAIKKDFWSMREK